MPFRLFNVGSVANGLPSKELSANPSVVNLDSHRRSEHCHLEIPYQVHLDAAGVIELREHIRGLGQQLPSSDDRGRHNPPRQKNLGGPFLVVVRG